MSLFPRSFDMDTWDSWIQQRRKRFFDNSLWSRDPMSLLSPEEKALQFQFPRMKIGESSVRQQQQQQLVQQPQQQPRHPLMTIDKDGFQACVDVQHFQPDEITVKTVKDTIIVEAKHEDREDEHGFISRSFYRKYILPPGYDPQNVVSTLSSDGVLTIKAPSPKAPAIEDKERLVQIQQTGPSKPADATSVADKPQQ